MSDEVDKGRRALLVGTTGAVGAVGAAAAAFPFAAYWMPSVKATAAGAPVEVDLSKIAPGEKLVVEWRKKPVFILRRSPEAVADLKQLNDQLRDPQSVESDQPDYCENASRALNDEFMVMVGICTHLGCSPTYRPEKAPEDLGADWVGGFLCPCHGGKYDLAGRVYKGVPPPQNLPIPPYRFLSETRLLIGEDQVEGGEA